MEPEALRERRLLIARRILAERLALGPPPSAPPEQTDDRGHAPPLLRTRELRQALRSPLREAARFYVRAELRLAATAALETLLQRLLALQTADRPPHERHIAQTVVQGLQSALSGSFVRLGLLRSSAPQQVDFADGKATRPSPCFQSIDARDLVAVDSVGAPGIVVFVPVIEANEGIGVLEIKGLVREGENLRAYERSADSIKAMLHKGSFR